MSAAYVSPGNSIPYTPGTDVAVKTMVPIGTQMTGVATRPIPANTKGSLDVEGLFRAAKKTGASTDWALGTMVYLDQSEAHVTHVEGDGDSFAGITVEATTTAATDVLIKLNAVGPQGPQGEPA
jgi:predicted RecA/RadA family phage recombinase